MNPILSDLTIRIAITEAQAGVDARSRLRLASETSLPRSLPALVTSFVNTVWQFVDPRGFAMKALEADGRSQARGMTIQKPRPAAPVSGATPPVNAPANATVTTISSRRPAPQESKPAA